MTKKVLLLCVVSAALGAALAVGVYRPPETDPMPAAHAAGEDLSSWTPEGGPPPATEPAAYEDLTPEERVNVDVYETTNRSAVNVMTERVVIERSLFFSTQRASEGQGSGTVIDTQGHVLTNFHVVEGARVIRVTLHDGKSYDAEIVGLDPNTDLAVLKIDAPAEVLHPVSFGTSTGLRVGQRVFAIGNPFGLERTLSTGIISSLNRALPSQRPYTTIKSIIQIDAAINPGNSGGPLLDSRGRMIGLNTAIASLTGESAGVGFAIPVNTILRIVPQLIEDGRVRRADIGIAGVYQTERGLLIAGLVPDGPAERAGLRGPEIVEHTQRQGNVAYKYRTIDRSAADLIVAIDGQPVRTVDDLFTIVEGKQPGDKVVVTVVRGGETTRVPVELDESE